MDARERRLQEMISRFRLVESPRPQRNVGMPHELHAAAESHAAVRVPADLGRIATMVCNALDHTDSVRRVIKPLLQDCLYRDHQFCSLNSLRYFAGLHLQYPCQAYISLETSCLNRRILQWRRLEKNGVIFDQPLDEDINLWRARRNRSSA
ncbi:hypothetical protein N7510_003203 [Penicillium lagena]|uniref:uncharacterized protein n=1 Tax=Penicillium lagena TaxID=94218 RepID=UPI0025414CA2|nr:uncharacterized protein N7510_003203 [Penicillium lagena]KAJ5619219.1 hypothetical protein N7510_003203 [Penicillium lagena]